MGFGRRRHLRGHYQRRKNLEIWRRAGNHNPDPNDELQFSADVYGVSDKIAYLLSIGNNTNDFKIYKTIDGGATWKIEFTNATVNAFYDCFAFWGPDRGIAHSDSVNGVFPDLRTFDGRTWQSIANRMPPALPGEASFSSSGTCTATQGLFNAWSVTGAQSIAARVLATRDGGQTWKAYSLRRSKLRQLLGPSRSAMDATNIVAGGDLGDANSFADAATSDDGGQTWTLLTDSAAAAGHDFLPGLRARQPLRRQRFLPRSRQQGLRWTEFRSGTRRRSHRRNAARFFFGRRRVDPGRRPHLVSHRPASTALIGP